MITTVLIVAIAAGLVPLIQRDLRIAHTRIEARRRRAAMSPLQRAAEQMARAGERIGFALRMLGAAAAADAEQRQALQDALRKGRRRPRDRWSIQ